MKILLTNTTLCNFYGSQMFIYFLALELKRQGHEVICYSPLLGKIADKIRQAAITVTDNLTSVPHDIDVIHVHHRHESLLVFAAFHRKPMIMVCHGILPWQEQPLKVRMNIYRYVAVSEEVKDHLVANHNIFPDDVIIIRNGVDTARFACRKPINESARKLLVLSNHTAPEQLNVVSEACSRKGIELNKIGFPAENVWDVEDYINDADIVVTLGRGVMEAAACKRVVIVYDYNGADGLVTKETFPEFRKKNFSGRTNRRHYTVEEFMEVLDHYDPLIPEEVAEFFPEHDLHTITGHYVSLYEAAVNSFELPSSKKVSFDLFEGIVEVLGDLKAEINSRELQIRETKKYAEQLTATQDAKATAESLAITRLAELEKLAERLRYTDEVKTAVEELAHTRLAEIERLQVHLTATQDAKATAELLAITRLAELDKLAERLRYTDEVKTAVEELAHTRLAEIERLQVHLTATQDAKATAESLAITRLAELDKLAERLRYTDEVKAVSEKLAHARLVEVERLQTHLTATQNAKATAESLAITRLADLDKLAERLRYADEVKTVSEKLAHARLVEIERLQAHLTATQNAKATAESLAITRLAELDKLRSHLDDVKEDFDRICDENKKVSIEIDTIRSSRIWKLLSALKFVTKKGKDT
jgi:glycosyltransferase involved in cell wall biosynthesis/uncharacterized small protein (DUF1192 family)